MFTKLLIISIRLDGGTQPRAEINPETVADYAEDMRNGAEFPPIVVYYDGKDYWLADGFHRVEAGKEAGLKKLKAEVHQGTRRDAILHSVGANGKHGLRRTKADKHRSVMTLLNDEEWRQWPIREIARRCEVSEGFVHKLYHQHLSVHNEQIEPQRTVTRGGSTYPMNTANIGNRPQRPIDLLLDDKWYPTSYYARAIHDEPFDTKEAIKADPRYKKAHDARTGHDLKRDLMLWKIVPPRLHSPDPKPLFYCKRCNQTHRQWSYSAPHDSPHWNQRVILASCEPCKLRGATTQITLNTNFQQVTEPAAPPESPQGGEAADTTPLAPALERTASVAEPQPTAPTPPPAPIITAPPHMAPAPITSPATAPAEAVHAEPPRMPAPANTRWQTESNAGPLSPAEQDYMRRTAALLMNHSSRNLAAEAALNAATRPNGNGQGGQKSAAALTVVADKRATLARLMAEVRESEAESGLDGMIAVRAAKIILAEWVLAHEAWMLALFGAA